MRILGFIILFSCTISNLTLRRRLPPKNVEGGLWNLAAFKSPAFTVYCLGSFVAFLGLYTGTYFGKPSVSLTLLMELLSSHVYRR